MSMLDSILKQVAGSPDTVAEVAAKVGIDPALAEKAIAALGKAQASPGNTLDQAAATTGLDTGTLGSILGQLGGEGVLGQIAGQLGSNPQLAGIVGMLDRDGDGNPLDDLVGLAGSLFGKK